MNLKNILGKTSNIIQWLTFQYLVKWVFYSLIIGAMAGAASAALLLSLEWATDFREANLWIIALLPLGGLIIGLVYHYWGEDVVKGNNQLLEEFHSPKKIIPFKMAPLVLFGTVATHFFGGSAGREGTAVQMGGAIADQFTRFLKIETLDRQTLITMGVSAGFASVFGTPLAGTVFALEVFFVGKMKYSSLIPSLLAAVVADFFCHLFGAGHTQYIIPIVPEFTLPGLGWAILSGILFGLAALIFSKSAHFWNRFFKKTIKYPPLRPVLGGIVISLAVYAMGSTKFIGLGIPTISASFEKTMMPYDFLIKILFTSFTLGAGFKGGEVTPLFFIGATLGNALAVYIPLPMALLAGMGFVAVFSGATNTPLACTLMGIELFGAPCGVFVAIACFTAYLFSGHTGIYGSQIIGSSKHLSFKRHEGKVLSKVNENTG